MNSGLRTSCDDNYCRATGHMQQGLVARSTKPKRSPGVAVVHMLLALGLLMGCDSQVKKNTTATEPLKANVNQKPSHHGPPPKTPPHSQVQATLAEEETKPAITAIDWGNPKIDPDKLLASYQAGNQFLGRIIDEDGKFAYVLNLDDDVEITDQYHTIRHVGTLFGLCSYLRRFEDEEVQAAALRATKFAHDQIRPVDGSPNSLAVWSDPKVTHGDHPLTATVGGTGLGLAALAELEHTLPGTTPRETLRKLAEFLRFMQKDDGSFYTKFTPTAGGRHAEDNVFAPGEAVVGLMALYELEPDPRWLEASAAAVAFMAKERLAHDELTLDHWINIAIDDTWPHYEKSSQPVSKNVLLEGARRWTEELMVKRRDLSGDPDYDGAIIPLGHTTGTATRLEGVTATLGFYPEEEVAFRAQMKRVTEDGLLFLMRSQVAEGKYRGAIPYAMKKLPEGHPYNRDGFNQRAGEIRIDQVYHAMSALMQYADLYFPQRWPRRNGTP